MSSTTTALPGRATLLACWAALTRLSQGARLIELPGAGVAVFPASAFLNNAVLTDLSATDTVISSLGMLYVDSGIDSWALWVPSDTTTFDGQVDRLGAVGGLTRDITTLVMHADLRRDLRSDERVVRGSYLAIERLAITDEPMPAADLGEPEDVPGLAAWALVEDGLAVASMYTFRHGEDCGVYSVDTVPAHRRRGLARALVAHALAAAGADGARTASLQSTPMGEPLYESLGFRAAGRYEEWVGWSSHPHRQSDRPLVLEPSPRQGPHDDGR